MQMIDILERLKQIQESNPALNINDAISNVERTNGAVDEKVKNPYAPVEILEKGIAVLLEYSSE